MKTTRIFLNVFVANFKIIATNFRRENDVILANLIEALLICKDS